MDFQRCRPTEYTYSVFDNVNDARMWKTFKTVYGLNNITKFRKEKDKDGKDISVYDRELVASQN
jgi:hypothetical protein